MTFFHEAFSWLIPCFSDNGNYFSLFSDKQYMIIQVYIKQCFRMNAKGINLKNDVTLRKKPKVLAKYGKNMKKNYE